MVDAGRKRRETRRWAGSRGVVDETMVVLSVDVGRGIMGRKGADRNPAKAIDSASVGREGQRHRRERSEMRKGRGLTRRPWKRRHKKEERQVAETLRLERETARLQNRQAAIQAESRERGRFGFGGPG
jgi:hypothetical protein